MNIICTLGESDLLKPYGPARAHEAQPPLAPKLPAETLTGSIPQWQWQATPNEALLPRSCNTPGLQGPTTGSDTGLNSVHVHLSFEPSGFTGGPAVPVPLFTLPEWTYIAEGITDQAGIEIEAPEGYHVVTSIVPDITPYLSPNTRPVWAQTSAGGWTHLNQQVQYVEDSSNHQVDQPQGEEASQTYEEGFKQSDDGVLAIVAYNQLVKQKQLLSYKEGPE